MNSKIKNRTLGATALLAILLGSAACGNETVPQNDIGTQPGFEARIYPPSSVPEVPYGEKKGPISADAAERKAAAEKAREDRASSEQSARRSQVENKLDKTGNAGLF